MVNVDIIAIEILMFIIVSNDNNVIMVIMIFMGYYGFYGYCVIRVKTSKKI
jgi:hypothetical protein